MSQSVLEPYHRLKQDNKDDSIFYAQPRFVYHLDLSFRNRLSQLYTEEIPNNCVMLDLMSSWDSYIPSTTVCEKIIGHGLNLVELQRNKRLDTYWVQDLNKNQIIPLDTCSVDFISIVAGWQYLQQPENLAFDLRRVARKGCKLIISFSNRAFWTKSPNIWVESTDSQRIDYISNVLQAQGWIIDKTISEKQTMKSSFLNFLHIENDPFYSVIAINN